MTPNLRLGLRAVLHVVLVHSSFPGLFCGSGAREDYSDAPLGRRGKAIAENSSILQGSKQPCLGETPRTVEGDQQLGWESE